MVVRKYTSFNNFFILVLTFCIILMSCNAIYAQMIQATPTPKSTPTPTPVVSSDAVIYCPGLCAGNGQALGTKLEDGTVLTEDVCTAKGGRLVSLPRLGGNPYIYDCCCFNRPTFATAEGCGSYTVSGDSRAGICVDPDQQKCKKNNVEGICHDLIVCDTAGNMYRSCECVGERIPYCGDDIVQRLRGEQCDPPGGIEGCEHLLSGLRGVCNACCQCVVPSTGETPCSERPLCSGNCTTVDGAPGLCGHNENNQCYCGKLL